MPETPGSISDRGTEATITRLADLLAYFESEEFTQLQDFCSRPSVSAPCFRKNFGIWYRGHSNRCHKLTPSLFWPNVQIEETSINWHFMMRAAQYRDRCHSSFDWLCLMRHYGMPSRLLDWSENPLVALYFACLNPNVAEGRMFVLNTRRLNQAVRGQIEGWASICAPSAMAVLVRSEMADVSFLREYLYRLEQLKSTKGHDIETLPTIIARLEAGDPQYRDYIASPVAAFPYRNDSRLIVQQSVFTIHGGKRYRYGDESNGQLLPPPLDLEDLDQLLPFPEKFLGKLTIGDKGRLLEELEWFGVSAASLFPDLDHEVDWLKGMWRQQS